VLCACETKRLRATITSSSSVRVKTFAKVLGCVPALVLASGAVVRAEPATRPGTASDAQPGIFRVPVAAHTEPAAALSVGYGYTEELAGSAGPSHRVGGRLAGALGVLPWLNAGAVFNARHDRHSGDSGTLIDGGVALRGAAAVGKLRLGGELFAWVPGSEDASTTFRATSLDARLLFGVDLGGAMVALTGGYRLDRGAEAGERAPRLGFGDRAALGLSDFDAVLAGVGASIPVGPLAILAEVSGSVLIGGGAPPFAESPLHATAGGRWSVSERLALELLVDGELGKRPAVGPLEPLVPIDPRVTGLVGLRYRFTADRATTPTAERPRPAPGLVVAPQLPPPPTDAPLEVVLTDEEGVPVRGAEVVVKAGERTDPLTGDDAGHYRNEHVPKGPAKLVVKAPGYEPYERDVIVEAGKSVHLPTKLKSLPPPSQVRGVVRSFGGQVLVAKVRVSPLGVETTTDENGAFQVDVAPGSYEVTIEAAGYESQRRQVKVDAQGVVILNADLVRKK
jgi:hypothetical protein